MFVFRVRKKQAKNFLWTAAIAAGGIAALASFAALRSVDKPQTAVGEISLSAENGCGDFLKQLHLTADAAKAETKEITIPEVFNDVYSAYNELQKESGLDLSPYKGRQAQQVTVPLQNSAEAFAVLLTCENRVIGGHLTSGEYGGEIKPLPILKEYNGTTG